MADFFLSLNFLWIALCVVLAVAIIGNAHAASRYYADERKLQDKLNLSMLEVEKAMARVEDYQTKLAERERGLNWTRTLLERQARCRQCRNKA